jgi:hypothetical protein
MFRACVKALEFLPCLSYNRVAGSHVPARMPAKEG